MFSRELINPQRRRRISGSFSWIDHRLLSDGHLKEMSRDEILLYFFYVLVGDRNGISFYNYQTICGLLKIDSRSFALAQAALIGRSLIAYQDRRVQVLQLRCQLTKREAIKTQRHRDTNP